MMKKLIKFSALSFVISAALITHSQKAFAVSPANPADIEKYLIKSPYMDFQVTINRAMIVNSIKSEYELNEIQRACLGSIEGNPNYLEVLEPYFKGILTEEEIKEADDFFATSAGQKFAEVLLRQAGAENLPPFIPPTAEEKEEIVKATTKPFFVKTKADTDAMSEEDAIKFTLPLYEKEIARCKISS